MSLRKKIKNHFRNGSGQGSLIGVLTASVILSVIIASATQWYLSFNKNLDVADNKLTGMSIAKDTWDRMTTMDFEKMRSKEGISETENAGGYTITKEYGKAGVFNESTGKCEVDNSSPTPDNPRSCMDVTITRTKMSPTSISGGGKLLTGGELISPASLKHQLEDFAYGKI